MIRVRLQANKSEDEQVKKSLVEQIKEEVVMHNPQYQLEEPLTAGMPSLFSHLEAIDNLNKINNLDTVIDKL